jgi:hypothetical protein
MTRSDFTEYAVKETKAAVQSRHALAPDQAKALDEMIWNLADDPLRFEPISRPTSTGQLVYRHPTLGIEVAYSIDVDIKVLYFYHFSAPLPPRQTIFISYSREDLKWLLLFRKFLVVLEQEGLISFWDDNNIKPGEPWEPAIKKALDAACAAVLLVSQDFLASNFIRTFELPRLLSDAKRVGKKVFWIQVSPCDVVPELREFQSLAGDLSISLEELTEPQQKRLLVQVSHRLREALNH